MKKTLSMITLAVLTVGLLGSCSKINERIDNLEKKVDGLENEKIASIQTQVDNIGNSISDLGAIRSNIQSLTDNAKSQGQDITDLQAADKALGSRIEELSKYVGDTLKAYATEEWARATFSTLGQYEKTCDTIAKIDARIGALDENLSKKIADCADSLTTWINGQFEGYYTVAEMDAKTDAMQAEIDSARAANLITDAKADSLAVELAKVQPAIDSAKAQLTREYTAAIDTAITTLDGKLTKQIQDEIEKVNEAVAALAQRVGILEFQVKDLLDRVGALESRVQSVTIVPAYSDGSVKVENDSLFLDCIITPASATRWLGWGNFTILVKGVAVTKAGVETIGIAPWDLAIDSRRGTASIKVKIADKLPGNDSTLAVAINVKDTRNGSDYTTEFVPVYVIPAGALSGVFSVSENKKVRFSKGNLWYGSVTTGTAKTFNFESNQYDYKVGSYHEMEHFGYWDWDSDHISHFFWSGAARVAYSDDYEAANAAYGITPDASDVFFTNATETTAKTDFTINGVTGKYRTLSTAEWQYLFAWKGVGDFDETSPRYNLFKYCITVCDTGNCVVLLPDDWDESVITLEKFATQTEYDEATTPTWQQMEAAGAVCLPAAGGRTDSNANSVGDYGYYCSSTSDNKADAYHVVFSSDAVYPYYTGISRSRGCSVRLVTDVK